MSPQKYVSYLSSVKFDPKLWNSIQAKYIVNFRLVLLLIVSIIAIGIVSFFEIPRRLNPEIKIPIVVVTTVLPGATPSDIESLVTVPLEDKLNGMEGLDTITSSSRENVSSIVMQFISTVDPEKAKNDVKSIVDGVTLPTDAKTPTVIKVDFENQPVWNFAVTTNADTGSLMRFAKDLKTRIETSPKIDKVVTSGFEQQEIQIVVDPVKIKDYGINPLTLSQTVAKATQSYPAGSINTSLSTFSLSIDQEAISVEDIRRIRITTQNQSLSLSDVATVVERPKLSQPRTYFASTSTRATPTIQFFVYRTKSANIDEAEQAAEKIVNETVAACDNRFQIVTVQNAAKEITDQFNELVGEFSSTIVLVFINLLLFLGLRQAIISSTTVPLTFLSSIAILHILGYTMNFLTMFAFLIALGLLIDDTIVTVAAMTRYYATGKFTPQETGVIVWRDFIVPLWSTTITTVWAFIPLLLSTGIIGEFIKPIPVVVTTTMLSSTSIAVLITLPLMIITLRPQLPHRVQLLLKFLAGIGIIVLGIVFLPKSPIFPLILLVYILLMWSLFQFRTFFVSEYTHIEKRYSFLGKTRNKIAYVIDHGLINVEYLSDKYMSFIDRVLRSQSARRTIILIIFIFAIAAYLLIPAGLVKNEFFPKSDTEILYVAVDYPNGTNLQTTEKEAKLLINDLRKIEPVKFVVGELSTQLDTNGERNQTPSAVLFTLHLPKKEERSITSIDLAEQIRERYKGYTAGTLTVQEQSGGPPAGADIQIKLLGDDLGTLDEYADKIVAYLKRQPGITNVSKSVKSGTSKITFIPDKNKLADAGLTTDAVAIWLRTSASGFTLDTFKLDKDDTDIVFRTNSSIISPEDLGTISIPTQTGDSIPLLALGTLSLEANPIVINREGGKRTLSVSATVTQGFNIADKNKDLEKYAQGELRLPPNYSWQTGGVNEENQKSVQSIFRAMALSFLLILVTMVIEFGSYRQAAIVMLTIPLAIPGVFYIFALAGIPLSFPALIGVLALFGIVVTNAIVVVEKINDNRKHGMNLHDAIVDASGSRLEPILLTSVTSILGLLPITLNNPLWRGLGGAIISGLLFSGLIKLLFVPVMYYMWYQRDEKKHET